MGKVNIVESGNEITITIDGNTGNISAGGKGQAGELILSDSSGFFRIGLNATNGTLVIRDAPTTGAIGQSRIALSGTSGQIKLKDSTGKDQIRLEGNGANIWLGGNGIDSDLLLLPSNATNDHDPAQATIHLDGQNGDIILKNADCAEEFDLAEAENVEPGTVMVLDQDGKLETSHEAYDKKVAGVISGAGDFKPGIVLDKRHSQSNRRPVALVGKVFCKVDAQYSAIEIGDLLTTSPTPGHAMKAGDSSKAFGAVIGKALRPLQAGQSMIPILIALQ